MTRWDLVKQSTDAYNALTFCYGQSKKAAVAGKIEDWQLWYRLGTIYSAAMKNAHEDINFLNWCDDMAEGM